MRETLSFAAKNNKQLMTINNAQRFLIVALLYSMTLGAKCFASDYWYGDRPEGFYWYVDPIEVKKKKPSPQKKEKPKDDEQKKEEPKVVYIKLKQAPETKKVDKDIQKPQSVEPKEGSAVWIKDNFPKILNIAIDNPTPENVKRTAYLHRLINDKADKFQEQWILAHQNDPFLDQNNYRPSTSSVREIYGKRIRDNVKDVISSLKDKVALTYFFEGEAPLSEAMATNVGFIQNKYNINVLPVSANGKGLEGNLFSDFTVDKGQIKALGIFNLPAMYLFNAKDNSWLPISQNYLGVQEMERRIIAVAYANGIIDKTQYNRTKDIESPRFLSPPPKPDGETSPIKELDPYKEFFDKLLEGK